MVRIREHYLPKSLLVFKVAKVEVEGVRVKIELKKRKDLESLCIMSGQPIYFEADNFYFVIIDDLMFYVPKRKPKGSRNGSMVV